MPPIIMHLDMNSYFASVEQQDNLAWRGKPVGVCEHLGGIIIGASVEAKVWGIKTGTPVWEARRLYPKIILTKTHPDRYRFYTARMVKVVSDYTNFVEKYSIDEVFLDVSKVCNVQVFSDKCLIDSNPFLEAITIAKEIKRRMKREVGDWLRCSIGIAENKLLAKIGSDMKKPDGITLVESEKFKVKSLDPGVLITSVDNLYHTLKLTDIPGIGRRQEKRLNELGIRTLRDLKNYPYYQLIDHFGILGHHLYNMGQLKGTWKPRVEEEEKIKSIGHMYTLPQEYRTAKYFVPVLYKLCEMVGKRLRQQNLMGNVLHFYVHDKDYNGFGQSKKFGYNIFDGREIFLEAMNIFEQTCKNINTPSMVFKLIGVTVAGLRPITHQQSLFERDERLRRVTYALDKINDKHGQFTVCRVPVLEAGNVFHDSIGFGRMKEFSKWAHRNR